MVASLWSGPLISAGNLMDGSPGTPQLTNHSPGPNLSYHGDGFLDVRTFPINKEYAARHGQIPAYFNSTPVLTINAIPVALGAANIAAAANPASGVPMTLASTAVAGIALNIPFQVFGTSTVVNAPITLDYGYEVATVVSGSKNVTVADSNKYQIGQPLIIASALTATTPLITYVTGITSATVITIANAAGNSSSTLSSVGNGNNWSVQDNVSPISLSTYAQPYVAGGPGLFFDPTQAVSRCVKITGSSAASGGAVTVSGWDIYGQPVTQTVTLGAGAVSVTTTKAFKYIKSIVPAFTDTHTISAGTSDVFGLPLRCDLFEQLMIFDNGALVTANTGWTAAVATSPATATTGDVRGTYAVQNASGTGVRLAIYQIPSFQQLVRSGPSGYSSLYGVTQV